MLYLIKKIQYKVTKHETIKAFLTHKPLNQVLMKLPFQSIKIIKGLYANTTITPKCHFL